MEQVLDVRGLQCPIPLLRARAAIREADALVVLATDPEAQIDLRALAADEGLECTVAEDGAGWRITLRR
jgi:tRNA 2-thiouridine synthesizing protein A